MDIFDKDALRAISRYFLKTQETIAVAESVTGGFLQAAICSAENASVFFHGGTTAYNAMQKFKHFHVDPVKAMECNCVSEKIAAQMALATIHSFSVDWAIAVTGYASNIPGSIENLYCCYAIVYKGKLLVNQTYLTDKVNPTEAKLDYVQEIIGQALMAFNHKELAIAV